MTGVERAASREDHRIAHGLLDDGSVLLAIHQELTLLRGSMDRLAEAFTGQMASPPTGAAEVPLREPAHTVALKPRKQARR